MENKYHTIVKEPKNEQANQSRFETFVCTKCHKRWETIEVQQANYIDTNGCEF